MQKKLLIAFALCIAAIFIIYHISTNNQMVAFAKYYEEMNFIAEGLANLSYRNIYINSNSKSGEMFADGKIVVIESIEVTGAIDLLIKSGFSTIDKSSNCVCFVRWSNLDVGKGFVYSIDGHIPDESSLDFLTKLEPLEEDGWYYYEEDYNEWRERNNGIPSHIIGVWNIQYAKTRGAGETGEDYPLQELYGTGIEYGGKLTFYVDGTFSRYVGIITDETDKYEGTYILRYDDKILLKYNDGTTNTVKYLPSSQEMVYYTWDAKQIPIDEYYTKLQ